MTFETKNETAWNKHKQSKKNYTTKNLSTLEWDSVSTCTLASQVALGCNTQGDSRGTTPQVCEREPVGCFLSSISVSKVLGVTGVRSKPEHPQLPQKGCAWRGTPAPRAGVICTACICVCLCVAETERWSLATEGCLEICRCLLTF